MRVIGTAGHVDHGKSTLIQALTGTHPDRLKEEREREMTIDLGFAWWNLPGGEEVGVVDVPGHRDFISNMLSGIGGIDAVLLVVAADEGVMPQTREHLAILDLLRIDSGVIAITKVDLIEDPSWVDLVKQDIHAVLSGTSLENAMLVPVSSNTKQGLDELQNVLEKVLEGTPARPDRGRPRLAVDRIFTMTGFGPVATGTLLDGRFRVGDEVEIFPTADRARIRGLQSHKRKLQQAVPGSRTAMNISGVESHAIQRGYVLTHPGAYRPTRRFDAHVSILPEASKPLKHNTEMKMYIAASETIARIRVLGEKVIDPGDQGWIQLELREPVIAVKGDRYILRQPSPGETIGGGQVVDPHPAGRHKRFSAGTIQRLETLIGGTSGEILIEAASLFLAAPLSELVAASHLDPNIAQQTAQSLIEDGDLIVIDSGSVELTDSTLVADHQKWDAVKQSLLQEIAEFHQTHPLRLGMPRQELKSRLEISSSIYKALIENMSVENSLRESGPLISLTSHNVALDPDQQASADALLAKFSASPFSPPSIKECISQVGEPLYMALVNIGELSPVSSDVVFRRSDFDKMTQDVKTFITTHGSISVSQARDHFKTTRRYVLALLEFLDSKGITKREGDARVQK